MSKQIYRQVGISLFHISDKSLQIIGQKRLDPTAATMIMSLESVFAVVFSALLLHKSRTPSESMGCVLVFAAVILSQLPEKK